MLFVLPLLVGIGCTRTVNEFHIHECSGCPREGDSLSATVHRLTKELEYERFRLQECLGEGGAEVFAPPAPRPRKSAVTKAAAAGAAKPGVVEEVDDGSGVTWYYDGRVPRDLGHSAFYLYMGRKSTGAPWLRLRAQYAGEHWLHVRGIRVKAGGMTFERRTDPAMVFAQADDALVTEWSDVPPSKVDLQVIARIMASPDARITFLRHRGEHTRAITDVEREAFQRVLQEYEALALKG